jgi:hypothetical protein
MAGLWTQGVAGTAVPPNTFELQEGALQGFSFHTGESVCCDNLTREEANWRFPGKGAIQAFVSFTA